MSRFGRFPRPLVAAVIAALLVGAGPPAPAAAQPPAPGGPPPAPAEATEVTEVTKLTLITGDRVEVTTLSTGGLDATPRAGARPAGAPPVVFQTLRSPAGDLYVIPSDAGSAIASGRLDLDLFNVPRLLEVATPDRTLPVIVQYGESVDPAGQARTTEALPGTTEVAPLPSLDAVATRLAPAEVARFWGEVATAATVEAVWLDGLASVTLDESVPQVGAPAAWQAGLDGTGVTVAVLDTGIDDAHPDLAGKVAVAKNFVGDGPPADGNGHGTHVASTVAGGGAGGQFTGVAPGARLVSGKVCTDGGQCPDSAILAGMQWAAVEQDADIVSMSLGGGFTDGTDLLSQKVNDLTAQTGALFVIAAGNSGAGGAGTVESPGAADAALTVGAVDKSDQLAGFSSRGPRVGDFALKPELTAPGVAITAARAGSTGYVAMQGTSMATPHVAGSAAILAQQHPDWSPGQLKAALVTSAAELPDRPVHQVGNGRLAIAAAIGLPLLADPPVVDFRLAMPADPPAPQTVTLTNPGATDLTVDLTAELRGRDGSPAAGRVRVTPPTLTVPAGGSGQVTVAFDAAGPPLGPASGAVRVRDTAGAELLRLPIAAVNEQWHALPVTVIPPPAPAPAPSAVILAPLNEPTTPVVVPLDPETHTGQALLPEGSYLAVAGTGYLAPDGVVTQVQLLEPEVTVDGTGELVLDGRTAQEVTVAGQRPTELLDLALAVTRGSGDPADGTWQVTATAGEERRETRARLLATPAGPVDSGTFRAAVQAELAQPTVDLRVVDGPALTASYAHHHLAQPQADLTARYPLVDVGLGGPDEVAAVDLTGKLALVGLPAPAGVATNVNFRAPNVIWERLRAAGAVGAVAYGLAERPTWYDRDTSNPPPVTATAVPVYVVGTDDGAVLRERAAGGPVPLSVRTRAEAEYVYTLRFAEDRLASPPVFQAPPDRQLVRLDSRYHATGPMDVWRHLFSTSPDGETLRTESWLGGGTARTELVGPVDPRALWWRMATGHDPAVIPVIPYAFNDGYRQTTFDVWTRPDRLRESWFDGPAVPGGGSRTPAVLDLLSQVDTSRIGNPWGSPPLEICHFCRGSHLIASPSAGWGPAHHWSWLPTAVGGVDARLFRDGQEVPRPGLLPRWELPPDAEPHAYRLTQLIPPQPGAERPFLRQGAQVTTAWDFRSQSPTGSEPAPQRRCFATGTPCQTESMLLVDYDFGAVLATDNTAQAPGLVRLPVTVHQQSEAAAPSRVDRFRARVSYDRGEHWLPVVALPRGSGRYDLLLLHPPRWLAPGDTVSLQVEASDRAGNRVAQTVLDAYPLAGRH